ncbi:hypothetical protein [Pyxidicoccus xibeiensis]|uniref:hypothetical protein n=1 Tax=Pyxidicoccus xibeiensis TaxID=2906759 RepID=UPI0020A74438|nr:hypothetical protein [Pyxidicoccus xibeiensis]MCP3139972.1 hypothetical protein [Pyxidicoccus xibeiensis]
MSALPPALRPWASQLSIFPDDLALRLGPYVARLSAALGSLRPRGETDGGEPQGYDGLTRRGTFDRLLVSEWLWALESPDELVRRAAFGELSFLKPSYRQPQGARRTVALLDAGPDQLGAPRIAHLALLIVLSRRAEAAGAAFSWAVLQSEPAKGAFSEVTPGTVRTWLSARSLEPPTSEGLAAWRKALSLDAAPEDAWLVGDARLSRLPGATGLSRVEVTEPLAADARRLVVEVRPASRAARSVVLDLPPPDDCVRLLREPFPVTRAATPVAVPKTAALDSFSFSADGRRLLLFHKDGSVGAMAIPHSVRATVPKVRRVTLHASQPVVGVGWRHTGGLLVLAETSAPGGTGYLLHGHLRDASPFGPSKEFFKSRDRDAKPIRPLKGQPPDRLLSFVDDSNRERVLLAGRGESLFLIEEDRSMRRIDVSRVETHVIAAAEVNRKVVFVTRGVPSDPSGASRETWLGVVEKDCVRHIPLGSEGNVAYFGYASERAHPIVGLLGLRQRPGLWRLFRGDSGENVQLPVGMRAVGVGSCREVPGGAGLLALDSDERTFWLISATGQVKVAVAREPVVHAEASHALPLLGWLMKGGGMVLWNLAEGAILYQSVPEGGG